MTEPTEEQLSEAERQLTKESRKRVVFWRDIAVRERALRNADKERFLQVVREETQIGMLELAKDIINDTIGEIIKTMRESAWATMTPAQIADELEQALEKEKNAT